MIINISFRITGTEIPIDHGYLLYSSLSHSLPTLHNADWLAVHSINGFPVSGRTLCLTKNSRLQFSLPPERLPEIIPLAGRRLAMADGKREMAIRLGVPEVYALKPAPVLHSRCVVIKVSEAEKNNCSPDREMFLSALQNQMRSRGINGEIWIDDRRDAQGRDLSRRIIHIKEQSIVGYAVSVSGLNAEDSLKLQEVGLGGRRRMGCGIFVPSCRKGGEQ